MLWIFHIIEKIESLGESSLIKRQPTLCDHLNCVPSWKDFQLLPVVKINQNTINVRTCQ